MRRVRRTAYPHAAATRVLGGRPRHHGFDNPAGIYAGQHIGHSPILEPLGAQLFVPHSVLDRSMSEPELQRPGILAAIGVVVPAGVPEHVHVHRKIETCFSPARSTIFANPDLVNGAPRSVTNTCRPSGQSRRSCRSALTSSPVSGCVDGTPFFFRVARRGDRSGPTVTQFGHPEPVARGHPDRQASRWPYLPRVRAAWVSASTSAGVRCSRLRTFAFVGRPTRRPCLTTVRKTGFEPLLIALPLAADLLVYKTSPFCTTHKMRTVRRARKGKPAIYLLLRATKIQARSSREGACGSSEWPRPRAASNDTGLSGPYPNPSCQPPHAAQCDHRRCRRRARA